MTGNRPEDELTAAAAAAVSVFDRVAADAEDIDPRPVAGPVPVSPDPGARVRDGIAAALHLFTDMVLQVVDGAVTTGPAGGDAEGAPLTVHVRPGSVATASVWLHNMTSLSVEGTVPRLTRCTAHDGTELDGADSTFEPAKLDVAAMASERVTLTLAVPPTAAAGIHVGHVIASGLPGSALAVHLVIVP